MTTTRHAATKAHGQEIRRLYQEYGYLDEDLVIKESRKKRSPLHAAMLWDDDRAAAEFGRHEIARLLIKSVTVTGIVIDSGKATVTVREWHGIGDGYRSVQDVIGKAELLELLLQEALDAAKRFRKKYGHLKALDGMMRAINEAIRRNEKEK